MRVIYASRKGGKPFNIGINHAKRIAHGHDKRDQLKVQQTLGYGLPRQHEHHQQLVRQRHAYYGDVYEQTVRVREAAQIARDQGPADQAAGDDAGAVPDAAPGADTV